MKIDWEYNNLKPSAVWYGHAMHAEISSQVWEVMEVEITGKRKKGQPRKSWEECVQKYLEWYGLSVRSWGCIYNQKNGKIELKQKLPAPASLYNHIKTGVVAVVVIYSNKI